MSEITESHKAVAVLQRVPYEKKSAELRRDAKAVSDFFSRCVSGVKESISTVVISSITAVLQGYIPLLMADPLGITASLVTIWGPVGCVGIYTVLKKRQRKQ